MGVLKQFTDDEIRAIETLSTARDFVIFRTLLQDSLNRLREDSDYILDTHEEYISKGQRQCLAELLRVTDVDVIRTISRKVADKAEASLNTFV